VAACGDKNTALIIDPIALGAIILLTVIMVFGVKESFWFNAATVVVSVIAILLSIFLGEQGRASATRCVCDQAGAGVCSREWPMPGSMLCSRQWHCVR
jgi:hypothetical protein